MIDNSPIFDKAFILAAGFGTRLRPYTDNCPKPMVSVAGQSLITRSIDKLASAGVKEVVVNLHYMADILKEHLQDYVQQNPDVTIYFSHENPILDTGGGVLNALDYFGDDPFYVIAGDALWSDGVSGSALKRLAQSWDASKMDIITLMQPIDKMTITRGVGDYHFTPPLSTPCRSMDKSGSHMWSNIRLNDPKVYYGDKSGNKGDAFSFLPIMDECEKAGRLYALEHDGDWHHISTPQDLENVNDLFKNMGKV